MFPQKHFSNLKLSRLATMAALLLAVASLVSPIERASSQGAAQESSKSEIEMVPPGQEKKLGIGIPAHLPLKIKVKNVNSKKWAHDIEVEVTNTSDKPIYFLSLYLILPEINGLLGSRVGFWLRYGRAELMSFSAPINSDDLPIHPNEKYIFKIPEGSAKGWDYLRDREGRPEPKLMSLTFQVLNFGDGTGFMDSSGAPVNIHKKISLSKECNPPPHGFARAPAQLFSSYLPASFLAGNALWPSRLNFRSFPADIKPDVCCTQGNCSYVKLGSYICDRTCDSNPNRPSPNFVGCTDPAGSCRVIDYVNDTLY